MRSSMFSPMKKLDKELQLEIAKTIELLARLGEIELAESYGKQYLALEEKIKTHDYSNADTTHDSIELLFRKRTP